MDQQKIKIAHRVISENHHPFIIAEMSANHNGSIERAIELIKLAKDCGADAVKLQTYKPDTITLDSSDPEFVINDGLWSGKSLYELYEEAHLPWEWHKDLFELANKIGILIFSSPFDSTAVELLESLGAPAYKVASFEATDLPLIECIAKTEKPMIISTGMANFEEIGEAVETARTNGCNQLAILHCVSGYPAPHTDYNLKTILDIKEKFNVVTGISDHTVSNTTSITSIAFGASIIEKHFTTSRKDEGPDSTFSLEPKELKALVEDSRIAWESIGKINYDKKESEIPNIKFRRSLYYVKDLKAGSVLKVSDFKSVRPGYGIHPKYSKEIVGKKLLKDIKKFSPIDIKDFK